MTTGSPHTNSDDVTTVDTLFWSPIKDNFSEVSLVTRSFVLVVIHCPNPFVSNCDTFWLKGMCTLRKTLTFPECNNNIEGQFYIELTYNWAIKHHQPTLIASRGMFLDLAPEFDMSIFGATPLRHNGEKDEDSKPHHRLCVGTHYKNTVQRCIVHCPFTPRCDFQYWHDHSLENWNCQKWKSPLKIE